MRTLTLIILILKSALGFGLTIKGKVTDTVNNEVLKYATIVILEENSDKIVAGAHSDSLGFYKIMNLEKGKYDIRVTYIGFDPKYLKNINFNNDTTLNINFGYECPYKNNSGNNSCPFCYKNDKVIPVVYGLPIFIKKKKAYKINNRKSKVYYAGCQITRCNAKWYCKRDKIKF